MQSDNDALSERKKMILKAIIDAHIQLGEPVGSKFLTQQEQIHFSSATIRNEMAELEEMGYLEQPHTSAGRIPSELGYRFYVDALMYSYHLNAMELHEMNSLLKVRIAELDKILDSAGKLMAMLTQYTSIAMRPKPRKISVLRFDTMWMDERNFILILVTSTNSVKTKYIQVSFVLKEEILEQLHCVLNDCLSGVAMDNITLPIILEMECRMGSYEGLINPIVKSIYEIVNEMDSGELKFEGVNQLLQYPEYADVERLRNLFRMFEQKEDLLNIVAKAKKDRVNIYIGSEISVDIMKNSSLIFKPIAVGARVIGAIGIIGPCRMDYSKVVALVNTLSDNVSDLMEKNNLFHRGELADEKQKK